MQFPSQILSRSESETENMAKEFSSFVNKGMVIVLIGELGAGKTFFTKKLLHYFNIRAANSPTFAIVNEYIGLLKFYHFDFYRINKPDELIDIGIEDYFSDSDAVCIIEWGNLFTEILPKERIEIEIKFISEDERLFEFRKL
ncbi:MAG: tRNA (adenosine(37)-N6)-threonylcarbamoyltransferase complex ATPase subunit type 1 TsaE [Ignavibacterium sp.]|jgi:tRNA threonylcarbamoyladenosine biosynthesis protein TsaE|nr:tRNA (adenosine(37)-N6)-threonylcarbamoyltransferase complex ATPase subunit type 1 TsaE [Ignavibacterium sp.]